MKNSFLFGLACGVFLVLVAFLSHITSTLDAILKAVTR